MANLTKNVGTVTLTGAVEKVTLPASYGWVWVKNMSEGDIFAGLSEDISEGADGVMTIPAGECGRVQADGFSSVYLLGTGNALVVAQNYADCPFKAAAKGGGSGGSGGGLTLLGRYANTNSVKTVIGTVADIPAGTKLLFISEGKQGNEIYVYTGFSQVPAIYSGSSSSSVSIPITYGSNTGNTYSKSLFLYNDGTNVKFLGSSQFSSYFDIYKV